MSHSPTNRTQNFQYFQQKARHYENLKKMRPAIQSFRTSIPSRPRPNSLLKQYEQMKINEYLVNNILSIRHKNKSRVEIEGGYSRYNDFYYASLDRKEKYKDVERYRDIQKGNLLLGERILKMKPSIGTIADWNARFETVKSRKKIASKLHQNTRMSIYQKHKFIPEYYRTFMQKDGSTIALRQKMFQIPKKIVQNYGQSIKEKKKQQQKQFKLQLDFRKIIKDASGEIQYHV